MVSRDLKRPVTAGAGGLGPSRFGLFEVQLPKTILSAKTVTALSATEKAETVTSAAKQIFRLLNSYFSG